MQRWAVRGEQQGWASPAKLGFGSVPKLTQTLCWFTLWVLSILICATFTGGNGCRNQLWNKVWLETEIAPACGVWWWWWVASPSCQLMGDNESFRSMFPTDLWAQAAAKCLGSLHQVQRVEELSALSTAGDRPPQPGGKGEHFPLPSFPWGAEEMDVLCSGGSEQPQGLTALCFQGKLTG